LPFKVVNMAALDNGDFIVLGANALTERPVLAIISDSGELRRFIDADAALPGQKALIKGLPAAMAQAKTGISPNGQIISALSTFEFAHHGHHILLLMPGSDALVISISQGGAVEKVPLRQPVGFSAQTIIPGSGGYWLIRGQTGVHEHMLLAFDPQDGSPVAQLDTGDVPPTSVMCESSGELIGVHGSGSDFHFIRAKE
jgi:hypothetical protein